MIIGAGLSVWLLNLLFRVGVSGDRERDARGRGARVLRRATATGPTSPPRAT